MLVLHGNSARKKENSFNPRKLCSIDIQGRVNNVHFMIVVEERGNDCDIINNTLLALQTSKV